MRFRTRLISTYSVLIIVLVVALAIGFYTYSARDFETTASSSLSVIAEKMSQQLDNMIRPMDFVTTYLLSNGDFMSSMASLATLDRANPRNLVYINEGWTTINAALLSYAVGKNFYSVNVFNRKGDFLSSNFKRSTDHPHPSISGWPWFDPADEAFGRALILPPSPDPWAPGGTGRVFGLARSVQGPQGGVGYIEVQDTDADLARVFSIPGSEGISVIALMKGNELFFSNGEVTPQAAAYYGGLAGRLKGSVLVEKNAVTGRQEIVAGSGSDYTGITVLLAQDRQELLRPLRITRNSTVLVALLVIALSLVYNLLSSRQLTMPLRRLAQTMEETGLANLPERITLENSNDEIEALSISFQRLRDRLNDSVGRQMHSQAMQMQAQLDFLQAQINPHFIYNVLTVISSRGMEAGDAVICEICDGMASMLRYSTSTSKRAATVREEIEHVRTYLSLMQRRFEHKLEYAIDVDPAILEIRMPKIVLQQIAENSLSHGFQTTQKVMRVTLHGGVRGSRWYVETVDNGQGFAPARLEELQREMDAIRQRVASEGPSTGLAIGGMGLINTCTRLALFLGPDFDLTLENPAEGGAKVTVGGRMDADAPAG